MPAVAPGQTHLTAGDWWLDGDLYTPGGLTLDSGAHLSGNGHYFGGYGGEAIAAYGATNVWVTDLKIWGDWNYGVRFEGGGHNIAAYNEVYGLNWRGIYNGGDTPLVYGNKVHDLGGRDQQLPVAIEIAGNNGQCNYNSVWGISGFAESVGVALGGENHTVYDNSFDFSRVQQPAETSYIAWVNGTGSDFIGNDFYGGDFGLSLPTGGHASSYYDTFHDVAVPWFGDLDVHGLLIL